jgi:bifunctional non-homologous end joining protein LigD
MSWKKDNRYGTYTGERGNPEQLRKAFDAAFVNSSIVKSIAMASTKQHALSVLGILPSQSFDEDFIKTIFRKKVMVAHPDRGGNADDYNRIVAAYQILMRQFRTGEEVDDIVITPPSVAKARRKKSTVVMSDIVTEAPTQTEVEPEDRPTPSNSHLIIPQLLSEIPASDLDNYLFSDEWCAQEKKDGRHITLQIKNGEFFVRNKKGDVSTCAPEFESSMRENRIDHTGHDMLIDGEHVGDVFWVWDILELDGSDLRGLGYQQRYNTLFKLNFGPSIKVLKLVLGSKEKKLLFEKLAPKKEGIVFKRLAAPFSEGKGVNQVKYKFYAEASVIVAPGRPGKASIGMELLNAQGVREFVGFCTCVLSPLPAIGSIAEIKYLYAYVGGCLIQPSFKELRDDVDLNECTTAQLKYKSPDEE